LTPSAKDLPEVTVYTDGACLGNPGPGGWAAVLLFQEKRKELSGGFAQTTNNRMELTAALEALEALKRPCRVKLHSDSQYLINAVSKGWAEGWRKRGWMRNKKERALNSDLWERLLKAVSRHEVEWVWVRGHAGNPENERCDELAVQASQGHPEAVDQGFLDTKG